MNTINKNIIDKLNNISSDMSTINNRLTSIVAENKVKETSKDRNIRQLLYPFIIAIIDSSAMAIFNKILIKLFP